MANYKLGAFGGKGVGRSGVGWTRQQFSEKGMKTWRLQGIEDVTRNINAAFMNMKNKSAVALLEAAKLVLNDADSGTPPLVPHDTGLLRQSRFEHPLRKPVSQDPYVIFGYEKNYAAAVHEMMESPSGKPINWTRPGSGPKFLEASLNRNQNTILNMITNAAKP